MRPRAGLLAAMFLLAGCVTEQEIVEGQENILAAAGFTVRLANTPESQAQLKTLPPHKFAFETHDGKVFYVYPDPTVCNCIYAGSEQAYQKFRQLQLQKQIADANLQAAQMNSSNYMWGGWGGPGWWW